MDPGILPKAQDTVLLTADGYVDVPTHPKEIDEMVNGIKVKRKWCHTCKIVKPLRASHCPFCNNCVAQYDHHCPWTGTCIGVRNYRFFFAFVHATAALSVAVLVLSAVHLVRQYHAMEESGLHDMQAVLAAAAESSYMAPLLTIYCAVMLCSLGGLAAFHTYLCCTGQTTREEMKRGNDKNPYDLGVWHNVWATCCVPIPPSLIHRRPRPPPPHSSSEPDFAEEAREEELTEMRLV